MVKKTLFYFYQMVNKKERVMSSNKTVNALNVRPDENVLKTVMRSALVILLSILLHETGII